MPLVSVLQYRANWELQACQHLLNSRCFSLPQFNYISFHQPFSGTNVEAMAIRYWKMESCHLGCWDVFGCEMFLLAVTEQDSQSPTLLSQLGALS